MGEQEFPSFRARVEVKRVDQRKDEKVADMG